MEYETQTSTLKNKECEADFSQFSPMNDPVLNKTAEAIDIDRIMDEDIQAIIRKMLDISKVYRAPLSPSFMVGLAAPQIGISKRIILADVDIDLKDQSQVTHDLKVFINPEITWKSEEMDETFEGCFSARKLVGSVPRSQAIIVSAYNEKGELIEKKYEGFHARVLQHEIDHLDGVRFPERIENEKKLHWVEDDEAEEYRDNYKDWKKTVSKEEWDKLSGKIISSS